MSLGPGDEFAGYRIEAVLGTGGMGAVYLARHPRLPRRDALKLLNPAFSADPNFRSRFEREADLAAGLIHRNIVAVYDRGSVDGQLWISMQYVGGTDAAVAVKAGDGSMTPQRVVHIVSEVGAGLDYAHRAGLLHRDVKPANILLAPPDDPDDPEHVLLTDFGIAKSIDEVQHLTGTGNLLATLAYASPEQIEAQPLDHRVDVYALGCVMYELLTGSVPFPGDTPFATMNAHLKQPPPRPSEKVPGLPGDLDDVVARAMAKDRDQRFATCRELSLAARAALGSAPGASVLRPVPRPTIPAAGPGAFGLPAGGPVQVVALTAPRPPFRVSVRRSTPAGGAELGPVATDRLPAQQRIRVEELLHRARFFDLPERLPLEYVVPGDVFVEITAASVQATRTVGYERQGARHPAELDEIVTLLEHLAPWRPQGPPAGSGPHPVPSPAPAPQWPSTVAMSPAAAAAFGAGGPPPSGPQTGPTGFYPPGGAPAGYPPPGPQGFAGPPGPPSVPPPGQVTAPPAQQPNRSRTWLIVAIVAVVAVIASAVTIYLLTRPTTASQGAGTEGTETPESSSLQESTTQESTTADTWGDLGYMVTDFPDMLPATPSGTGYDGATCSVTDDTEQSGVDGLVSCIDPAGRYWEVMHFPDTATRDGYLQRDWSGAVQEPWSVDDAAQGTLYRSADDEATLPYVITTFDSPQRELYLLYAHWSEHTTTQLIDEWWKPAAF